MLDEKETFTALFNQLTNRVKNSPTKLSWLTEQKSDIRRLAFLVGETARKIEKNHVAKSEKHSVVPPGYITAWRDYENRYKAEIDLIVATEREKSTEEFLQKIREIAEAKNKDFDSVLNEILDEIGARNNPGDSFDPLEDDPAELIDDIFCTYHDMVANDFFSDDLPDKAIGAWYFFDKTIGLDHRAIYKRWKSVPELLIPKHALSVNPRPIEELYNEAVKTYVFGNKVASISMCRALLEHILQKHYRIEEEGLDKMITIAEGRFKQFRKLDLHKKRKLANRIMHDYEKQSDLEDKIVVDFLKTIQEMVKNIPK